MLLATPGMLRVERACSLRVFRLQAPRTAGAQFGHVTPVGKLAP